MKLTVVIPAFNEEKTIAEVIGAIPKKISGVTQIEIIVVDDQSRDKTGEIGRSLGATVLRHRLNLGAGGATLTGIDAARKRGADMVITIDGDGQHDPKEIVKLVQAHLESGADLVIGSRFLSDSLEQMPALKNFGNRVMNGITYMFSGKHVTDSQSGFRLFGRRLIAGFDRFTTSGYEFCSETIINTKKMGLKIVEVPISTIYFEGRRGQNPLNGVNILLKLIYKTVTG